MGLVLLLDGDPEHARKVVRALRSIVCQIVIRPDSASAVTVLRMHPVECVVVVPAPDVAWHYVVDTVRQAISKLSNPPEIVCLLRGPYLGPNDRVYAARKGFLLIYE